MIAVHMKMHPWMALPIGAKKRKNIPLQRKNHREIPGQNMDMQIAALRRQIVEISTQIGVSGWLIVGEFEMNAVIELPASDEDRLARKRKSVR